MRRALEPQTPGSRARSRGRGRGRGRGRARGKRSRTELMICPTLRVCERAERHVTAHLVRVRARVRVRVRGRVRVEVRVRVRARVRVRVTVRRGCPQAEAQGGESAESGEDDGAPRVRLGVGLVLGWGQG